MPYKRKARRRPVQPVAPPPIIQKGFGTEMPPQKQLVDIYFDQKGYVVQAAPFYDFYEQANWSSPKGTPYRNWKLLATDWIFDYQQALKLKKRQRENALL